MRCGHAPTAAQATYIILTTILLLNLLVAILSNRYRPDDLEADTQMRISRVVDYYDVQVEHGLVCSPFCLVQVSEPGHWIGH